MTKVVVGMSVSLDGIAGPEAPDADGMKVFAAVMDWVFPLRSWRAQQGQEGGEVGRGVRLFSTSRADLRCTEAIQGEGAVHLRYEVR
jgi:hypothetical protein